MTTRRAYVLRQDGWNDGYALRPAANREAVYQAAWRQGRAERERDRLSGATVTFTEGARLLGR